MSVPGSLGRLAWDWQLQGMKQSVIISHCQCDSRPTVYRMRWEKHIENTGTLGSACLLRRVERQASL